ncbi:MAG: hypothetical protein JSR86_08365 [Proteobacteria bacterium]|nr:hypothetical protein [Pseudomonadota bacterium]
MRPWLVLTLGLILIGGCHGAPGTSLRQRWDGMIGSPPALKGYVYVLPPGATHLPDFAALKPAGVIYVRTLSIHDRDWRANFPGVPGRDAWLAVDYHGDFATDRPGPYRFILDSDDGDRLIIDGRTIVEMQDAAGGAATSGTVNLAAGRHTLRAQYVQAPGLRSTTGLRCQGPSGPETAFPGCGLRVEGRGIWRVWLWWVATLATLGATVMWLTRRRLAHEARGHL